MRISDWSSDVCSSDLPSPTRSSVLVRLSHSHIRIGTFQRIAFERDKDMMTKLVEYCLAYLDGDADANLSPPIALLRKVVANTANQIGSASCRERVCESVSVSAAAVS